MSRIDRIKELVEQLNAASDAYYNTGNTIMEDKEFDTLFDELKMLEGDTGFIMSVSPTQNVGYEVKSELKKVKHNHPMLSLDKTKDVNDIVWFLDERNYIVMGKMDGLTCSLRYLDGELVSAETRGNGEVGEDILHCAKVIKNIPLKINHPGELVVDGEVIITYDDFEKINVQLPDDQKYKNPRNLASGSIRQLDSSIAAQRNMKFIAWKAVDGIYNKLFSDRLMHLKALGFEVVPYTRNHSTFAVDMKNDIDTIQRVCREKYYPIDGCVIGYDNVEYGESLGATGHHLRSQLAYKFEDETYETELLDIEWTVGRTGIITPTAIFEPVEIDGTVVERASVHNISVLTQLDLHVGDIIEVYKANMIIPQVHKNISAESRINTDYIIIPATCPVCGGTAEIKNTDNSKILTCINPDCTAKKLAQFTHFVSRNCMDIRGLSEATLETFISQGYLKTFKDIYYLHEHRNKLIRLDGFGPKSIDKLLASIEKSREVKLENFIAALGIPNIGLSAAKTISKYFDDHNEWYHIGVSQPFRYTLLDDFGDIMMHSIHNFSAENRDLIADLMDEMNFIKPEKIEVKENPFTGKNICVTGKIHHFTRNSINEKITSLGAKAVGSVSSKTDYLITNEQSGSSKYKKAVELNISIITEDEFLEMIGE